MKRLAALTLAFLAFAVPAAAGPAALPVPDLPAGWSHAEINVTRNGASHTLIYDRGRIDSTSPSAIGLRELDGSLVTIPVDANTKVVTPFGRARLAALRVGQAALAVRIDGGAAQLIRVQKARG